MKSTTIFTALALSAAVVLAGCSSSEPAGEGSGPDIVIGLVSDQSGPGAAWNNQADAVIEALIEKQNSEGGVLGRQLRLVQANDESDPTKTPTALSKVISEGASAIFHHSGGAAVLAGKTVSVETEIPTIASTNSNVAVPSPPDNAFTYTLASPSTVWASTYCAGMERAGIENLAVVIDDSPAMATFSEGLLPAMDCVNVVAKEQAAADGSNVSAAVARVADVKPDAVIVLSAGTAFELQADTALATQLPGTPRFATAALGNTPSEWDVVEPEVLEGIIFVGAIDDRNPRTQEATEEMSELIPGFQMTQFSGEAYDAFKIMIAAIESAGSDDPVAINEALESMSGYVSAIGAAGLTMSFAPDKHLGADSNCGIVLQIFGDDGKPSGIWENYVPDC